MRSIPPTLPAGTEGLLSLRLVKRLESQPASFLSHPLAQHKVLARGGLPRLALDPVLNTDVIVGKFLIIAFEFVYCGHDSGILRDRRGLKCIPMRDSYRSVVEGGPGNRHQRPFDQFGRTSGKQGHFTKQLQRGACIKLVVQAQSQLDNIATLPLLTATFVRPVRPVAR